MPDNTLKGIKDKKTGQQYRFNYQDLANRPYGDDVVEGIKPFAEDTTVTSVLNANTGNYGYSADFFDYIDLDDINTQYVLTIDGVEYGLIAFKYFSDTAEYVMDTAYAFCLENNLLSEPFMYILNSPIFSGGGPK